MTKKINKKTKKAIKDVQNKKGLTRFNNVHAMIQDLHSLHIQPRKPRWKSRTNIRTFTAVATLVIQLIILLHIFGIL